MSIQIYYIKRNFDMQKAERFLKERRIPYSLVDVHKKSPGKRELELFLRQAGPEALINWEKAYLPRKSDYRPEEISMAVDALYEHPDWMNLPVLRNGSRIIVGYDEKKMGELIP